MEGLTLLTEAWDAGLEVLTDGYGLLVRGPRRAEPLVQRLLASKHDVLRALAGRALLHVSLTPDHLPVEWRIEWEERAAIREYEGGQAREHAEAEALREIIERMRAVGEHR